MARVSLRGNTALSTEATTEAATDNTPVVGDLVVTTSPASAAPPPPLLEGTVTPGGPSLSVHVAEVADNPINRRTDFGDLQELADSMATVGQVQPCAVVSRRAYLAIYPEHEDQLEGAGYVIVGGARRRRAAELRGMRLLIHVNNDLAESRGRFYAACYSENSHRKDFDPLEEAHALQDLIREHGSGKDAAAALGVSAGFVSQRVGLLRLAPALQEELRAKNMTVETARSLAASVGKEPAEVQLQCWLELRYKEARTIPKPPSLVVGAPAGRGRPARHVRVSWPTDSEPDVIVGELVKVLDSRVLEDVVAALRDRLER